MTKPIEEMLIRGAKDNNAAFMAGYEEGYWTGKCDALRLLKVALESVAELPHETGKTNEQD